MLTITFCLEDGPKRYSEIFFIEFSIVILCFQMKYNFVFTCFVSFPSVRSHWQDVDSTLFSKYF